MKRSRLLAVTVAAATTMSVHGVIASPAEAISPSAEVSTSKGGVTLSWRTPATNAKRAHIANTRSDSSAASVITIADRAAPRSYSFPVTPPKGGSAAVQPDGSVLVADANGAPLGSFLPPWAKDAGGRTLATHYALTGNVLTQFVAIDEDTRFPVTADPQFTWGWVTGTVYFNKRETISISSLGAVLGACAAFGFWSPLAIGVCAAVAGELVAAASIARNHGECVKVKFSGTPATPVYLGAYAYRGGYCT